MEYICQKIVINKETQIILHRQKTKYPQAILMKAETGQVKQGMNLVMSEGMQSKIRSKYL